jgi:hypothetical protein
MQTDGPEAPTTKTIHPHHLLSMTLTLAAPPYLVNGYAGVAHTTAIQELTRHCNLVPWNAAGRRFDRVLVSFAGQKHQISRTR